MKLVAFIEAYIIACLTTSELTLGMSERVMVKNPL